MLMLQERVPGWPVGYCSYLVMLMHRHVLERQRVSAAREGSKKQLLGQDGQQGSA
jgi:hypothetical protein